MKQPEVVILILMGLMQRKLDPCFVIEVSRKNDFYTFKSLTYCRAICFNRNALLYFHKSNLPLHPNVG